jgi:hypothetical protein
MEKFAVINKRFKNWNYLGWLRESANLFRTEGKTKVARPKMITAII